jgi:hypothetical protein
VYVKPLSFNLHVGQFVKSFPPPEVHTDQYIGVAK